MIPANAFGLSRTIALVSLIFVFLPGITDPCRALDLDLDGIEGFWFDNYNRVDGLPVTYGLHGGTGSLDFHLEAIYRIANERGGWRGAITFRPARDRDIALSLSTYSFSDTRDRWRVGDFENSLSSFLFKEDFRNYYQRKGLTASLLYGLNDILTGEARYRIDEYGSLETRAGVSLFGWAKEFRDNPPVEEGWMGSVELVQEYDTRNDVEQPTMGWHETLLFEISDPALGGDFDFHYTELSVRRFNRVGRGKNIDMRLFAAIGSETAPPQRGIHIHGVGGLRGYPDRFVPHYRAFVSSVEARFSLGKAYRKTPLYRDRIRFLLFADVGGVRSRGPEGAWTLDGDAGVGLEGSGLITYSGIFLALDLDDRDISPRLTFRVRKEY